MSTPTSQALVRRLKCDRKDKGRGDITIFVWERDDVATKIRKAFLELKKDQKGLAAHLDVMVMLTTTRDQLDVLLRGVPNIGKVSARALRFLATVAEVMDRHTSPAVSFEELLAVLDRAVPALSGAGLTKDAWAEESKGGEEKRGGAAGC